MFSGVIFRCSYQEGGGGGGDGGGGGRLLECSVGGYFQTECKKTDAYT